MRCGIPPTIVASLIVWLTVPTTLAANEITFERSPGRVIILVDGHSVATYVYQDPEISRPYFAHVRAPGGVQVTRNHPPVEGSDRTDHPTYHPGLWMAFGDISGSDYWRLKAPVKQAEFVEPPHTNDGYAAFRVKNVYHAQDHPEQVVCEEVVRHTFSVRPSGYLLTWDSTFSSSEPFVFGDQEEMGLGLRVATPLTVDGGNGTIIDALGNRNGKQVRGSSAAWCDYRGTIEGRSAGIMICCHPENFRPSWYHARDYGFIAANPFGRHALTDGEKSAVAVQPGETLRLRYGLFLHAHEQSAEHHPAAAYQDYLDFAKSLR